MTQPAPFYFLFLPLNLNSGPRRPNYPLKLWYNDTDVEAESQVGDGCPHTEKSPSGLRNGSPSSPSEGGEKDASASNANVRKVFLMDTPPETPPGTGDGSDIRADRMPQVVVVARPQVIILIGTLRSDHDLSKSAHQLILS